MGKRKLPVLRPGVTSPDLWYPKRPKATEWERIRKTVLERDNWTCVFCKHRARKWMNLHHVSNSGSNSPKHLAVVCVACHAVLHIGYNLGLGIIEIWKSKLSQVEIVRRTREGIRKGRTLTSIKKSLQLTRGPLPPKSIGYANGLVAKMGRAHRAYLKEPLRVVFVKLKRWQIEDEVSILRHPPNKPLQTDERRTSVAAKPKRNSRAARG